MRIHIFFAWNGQAILKVDSAKDLGVLVDTNLKFHTHIHTVCQKAGGLAQNLLKSLVSHSPEFMMFLLKTYVRLILVYCSSLWNAGYLQDLHLPERVQQSWTKYIFGLETLSYTDRRQSLQLFSIQGMLTWADLLCWKIFHGNLWSLLMIFLLSHHWNTPGAIGSRFIIPSVEQTLGNAVSQENWHLELTARSCCKFQNHRQL